MGPPDLARERDFIETNMNSRFNFFLLFFSLVIVGAVTPANALLAQLVLGIGSLILFVLWIPIFRSHVRLDIIVFLLDKHESGNDTASRLVESRRKERPKWWYKLSMSSRHFIGWVVPWLCILSLWLLFGLSLIGRIP